MTPASIARCSGSRLDARAAVLALVIGHQTRIAAERAATARDVRRAQAAGRAADAVAGALAELERLIRPDWAAWADRRSGDNPMPVPGTITPAERAWVLGWHLAAAVDRLHGRASDAGRPKFGERETAKAVVLIREALGELEPLLERGRRIDLRRHVARTASSLDAQLRLFAQLLVAARRGLADREASWPP